MNKALFSTGKNDWETPATLYKELDDKYHFTLDPCCTQKTAKCKKYYTPEDDGLQKDWQGETVFCNPPYSQKEQTAWVKKCYEESLKPNTTVVMLIPARTDTRRFHDYILPYANITFLRGRLTFVGADNPAPFPSMIVEFKSQNNTKIA